MKALSWNSPRILHAHCQSRTSPPARQSFVKELAKPTQNKIVFKNFSTLQKKIKNATHNPTQTDKKTLGQSQLKPNHTKTFSHGGQERQLPTACCLNWR
jgi:hypothetical protein